MESVESGWLMMSCVSPRSKDQGAATRFQESALSDHANNDSATNSIAAKSNILTKAKTNNIATKLGHRWTLGDSRFGELS